jgi:predicted HAD superfamily hydrolase
MKCRYDPKCAPQYKSKHTKYVKLSKKVFKPLDTQKYYPNSESPHVTTA